MCAVGLNSLFRVNPDSPSQYQAFFHTQTRNTKENNRVIWFVSIKRNKKNDTKYKKLNLRLTFYKSGIKTLCI